MTPNSRSLYAGFTLAEVLIALVLLGVIAAFTIPKLLISLQDIEMNAKTKEAMAMFSEAYQRFKQDNNGTVPASTTFSDLLPYINYLEKDTTTVLDSYPAYIEAFYQCEPLYPCIKLPNGLIVGYSAKPTYAEFGDTTSNRYLWMLIDPDSKHTIFNTGDGRYKALYVMLYYDGTMKTRGTMRPDSTQGTINFLQSSLPGTDPAWFKW